MAAGLWHEAKRLGFSDDRIGQLLGLEPAKVSKARTGSGKDGTGAAPGPRVTYKRVDTCAAEFEAYTPYTVALVKLEEGPTGTFAMRGPATPL